MAIVREAALRMQFGGREVAKAQLRYVLERSEQDEVTVLVIPFAKYRAHFGLDGAHRPLMRGITRLHPRDRQRLPRGRPMSDITREAPFCGEGNFCFRLGTDATGNAYVALDGAEDPPHGQPGGAAAHDPRRQGGKADHLL
ncbi:hypothetical protein GCM10010348_67340 [Streptomyces anthocyanicus]|uniref:DUF5753 domain-containing protein n=1 Tax=Streptomyces violaceolatus TaxID=67378 RepID=A0ABN3TC17_9ACTN|nr:hypothetical protein JCM4020_51110 [Streptomyces coelicolor]GHC31244.1 hypothetical protein GCM10010348_67340 [Streptomyces anthocyanicus]